MNLDEAIKVLENGARIAEVNDRPYEVRALQLGIEAIELERERRKTTSPYRYKLLPGETEDSAELSAYTPLYRVDEKEEKIEGRENDTSRAISHR